MIQQSGKKLSLIVFILALIILHLKVYMDQISIISYISKWLE